VIELTNKLAQIEANVAHDEKSMDQLINGLYMLEPADLKLIQMR
jgi:hypothetical protein